MTSENKRCEEKKIFLGKKHICGVKHGATLRTWYCNKHRKELK